MIIGVISFIIFLFCVYQLAKDDFIFIRKNITTEDVFNVIFLTLPIALLAARILFVALHPKWEYLNPLVFFIVPYFPGLSLLGGIVGAWIFIVLYTSRKKILTYRLFDILSVGFFFAYSSSFLMQSLVSFFGNNLLNSLYLLTMGIVSMVLSVLLLVAFSHNKLREGSTLFLVFLLYCLLSGASFLVQFLEHKPVSFVSLGLTGGFFLLSLLLFIRQEKTMKRLLKK